MAASNRKSPGGVSESHSNSSLSPDESLFVGKAGTPTQSSPSAPSVYTASDIIDFNDIEEVKLINEEQLQIQQLAHEPWNAQPSWQLTVNEAVSYFLWHNVWPGEMFMVNFKLKSPGHPNATLSEQAQMAALVSVGTAMIARVRRTPDLDRVAAEKYELATTLLLRAMANEKESRANATLSAVLLMAIYEV